MVFLTIKCFPFLNGHIQVTTIHVTLAIYVKGGGGGGAGTTPLCQHNGVKFTRKGTKLTTLSKNYYRTAELIHAASCL